MQSHPGKYRFGVYLVSILAIVALCFLLWYLRVHYRSGATDSVRITSENGDWDLSDVDFEHTYAWLDGNVAYIPGELLTPEAFEQKTDETRYGKTNDNPVNTARLRVYLPDDTIYMLTMHSVDFAERIYINGELRQEVGSPGLTAGETTEGFAHMYFEVRPIDGWIEIIRQSANFVHRENGDSGDIRIGNPLLMKRRLALKTDMAGLTIGLFFALFLALSMLYWLLRRYRANLYAALLCLVMGMRIGVTEYKVIAEWFPDIPWAVLFRLEYIAIPAMSLLILLVVRELFPGVLPRWFTRTMGTFFALLGLLCIFLPTYPLSYCAVILQAGMMLCGLFMSIYLSLRMPGIKQDEALREAQWVTLVGLWLLSAAVINDALYYNSIHIFFVMSPLNDLMMMILAFLLMGAVFSATMRQAAQAQAREQRMADEKRALEELGQRKSAFYADISHELKTPLTVIAANAQFAAQSIRSGMIDEETEGDLDAISTEARRLGQMVTGLVNLGRMQEESRGYLPIAPDQLIRNTAQMYGALTGKRGNAIAVSIAPGLPQVRGNADELSQVLINLLQNANRHTVDGQITVAVHQDGDWVRVTVTDTGEGIPSELLPMVFDRFIRGDEGGTGLGLPISKAIVTAHGGSIGIESVIGKGTTVWFTLPVEGGHADG